MSLHFMEAVLGFLADISWPLVVVLAVIVFKKPFSELIGRIKKAGKGGIEFSDLGRQSPSKSIKLPDYVEIQSKDWPDYKREYIDQLSRETKAILDSIAEKGEHEPQDQLFEAFVFSLALNKFEGWYNDLYKSQILALTAIKNSGGIGPIDIAREEYGAARGTFPDFYSKVDFETWLAYLINIGVITRENDNLSLTAAGNSFLLHIGPRDPHSLKVL